MNKPVKLDNYPFDGWDFMEFSDAWNIPVPYNSAGNPYTDADCIRWYLQSVMSYFDGNPTRVMRKCAKDIRLFTKELGKSEISYISPMWEGMSKIEDDWTLIGVAMRVMDMLWD